MSKWAGSKETAIAFVREYARDHLYFNGGEVLEAWRETDAPEAQEVWRNRWGPVMNAAAKLNIIRKAGRTVPKSKQSHTTSLVLWKSRVYTGPDVAMEEDDAQVIKTLFTDVEFGNIGLQEALQKAYDYGFEQGALFKMGVN